jgi:uncharacterized protein
MITVKLFDKVSFEGFTLVEGFPGIGLVGPMAISYMIDKLGMQYCGYIESDEFPPLVSIHDGTPMPPVRLYINEKLKLVTVFAEFAIPVKMTYDLASELQKLISAEKIAKIISIGGMPSRIPIQMDDNPDDQAEAQNEQQAKVFAITSLKKLDAEVKKAGLSSVSEGVATGISAMLLINAARSNVPDITVLVPVDQNIVDPRYAEQAIKAIDSLAELKIDTTELDREAKEVEAKIREMIKKSKESHESLKQATDSAGPSMYA